MRDVLCLKCGKVYADLCVCKNGFTKEMRNRFLTEAMGKCWHLIGESASGSGFYECRCGKVFALNEYASCNDENDFSTWEGFGKLWEWAQEQEWWRAFALSFGNVHYDWLFRQDTIHPDRFADALYEFLKEVALATEEEK